MFTREFPDFDYDFHALIAELPEGWADTSWHNDSMPSAALSHDVGVRLWFDYADAALSEMSEWRADGSIRKFTLVGADSLTMFQSDDWAEMREWIKSNSAYIVQCNAAAE